MTTRKKLIEINRMTKKLEKYKKELLLEQILKLNSLLLEHSNEIHKYFIEEDLQCMLENKRYIHYRRISLNTERKYGDYDFEVALYLYIDENCKFSLELRVVDTLDQLQYWERRNFTDIDVNLIDTEEYTYIVSYMQETIEDIRKGDYEILF